MQCLTLKAASKIVAHKILFFFFCFRENKAKQTIHMKCHALISLENKTKFRMLATAFVTETLNVKLCLI